MTVGSTLLFALLGGVLPALLWLWFWLKEDKARPEPRGLIILSFIAGMTMVLLVIPFEKFSFSLLVPENIREFSDWTNRVSFGVLTAVIVIWSAIEEILKYLAGVFLIFWRKANDEPIDAMIYMITIALGFAALENTLFLINPLEDGQIITTINTGNLRFIGATVLHTLASAIVGGMMALSFYKLKHIKKIFTAFGLIFAILLHALFNFTIISTNGEKMFPIFFTIWLGIILLILFFEKIKKIYNRNLM